MNKKDSKGQKKGKGAKNKLNKSNKPKKDPNEPPKPVSAYASFFRDTQAAIKSQNPDATFGEVSKIVASMWESLDFQKKKDYKAKADIAKKEYVKALAAYRASKGVLEESDIMDVEHGSEEFSEQANSSPVAPFNSPLAASSPAAVEKVTVKIPKSPTIVKHEVQVEHDIEIIELPSPTKDDDDVITIEDSDSLINLSQASGIADSDENKDAEQKDPNITNGTVTIIVPELPMCVRSGCTNRAVNSPEWDSEYCSSECVVEHCNAVFNAHLAERKQRALEEKQRALEERQRAIEERRQRTNEEIPS